MTGPTPIVRKRLRGLSTTGAFGVGSFGLMLVFASSGMPVPLYTVYRAENGLTDSALAVTTVVYLAVTAATLLFLGRLSDAVGRRPVITAALVSSALGCLLLTQVDSLPILIAGRSLQGLACGLAASSLGSYVVETAPRSPSWLGPLMAASAPTFGIPLGAVVSGVLVETAPAPRLLGYESVAALLLLTACVMIFAPESVARPSGAVRAALVPRIAFPRGSRRASLITLVVGVFLATWSYTGFYQAFAPALTVERLGTTNSVVVSLVFASIVALSPLGGAVTGRLAPFVAIRVGLIGFLVTVATAVAALAAGSAVLLIGASLAAGVAMGAATTGVMRALLADAPAVQRAGLLAAVYLVSYLAAALPSLVASIVAPAVDLLTIAVGYGVLVLVAVALGATASAVHTRRSRDRG